MRTEDTEYWDKTGRPNERATICVINGHACRCTLLPKMEVDKLIKERNKLLDEAIEGMFGGIKVDIGVGGRAIDLKQFEQIEGMLTLPYAVIEEYENLIWTWKLSHPKIKYLPNEFYELADIKKQMSWLRKALKDLGITKIQDTRGLGS
jgi:hypothetical protein